MDIDGPTEFGRWLDRLEDDARSGNDRSQLILTHVARALDQLRGLTDPPGDETETATLKRVRQSRRYQLWRVSHAYHPEVAVRLICWFPPGAAPSSSPCSPSTRQNTATCSTTRSPHAPTQ